jgi:hypothetical protein
MMRTRGVVPSSLTMEVKTPYGVREYRHHGYCVPLLVARQWASNSSLTWQIPALEQELGRSRSYHRLDDRDLATPAAPRLLKSRPDIRRKAVSPPEVPHVPLYRNRDTAPEATSTVRAASSMAACLLKGHRCRLEGGGVNRRYQILRMA